VPSGCVVAVDVDAGTGSLNRMLVDKAAHERAASVRYSRGKLIRIGSRHDTSQGSPAPALYRTPPRLSIDVLLVCQVVAPLWC
jgi:hypothetical protein